MDPHRPRSRPAALVALAAAWLAAGCTPGGSADHAPGARPAVIVDGRLGDGPGGTTANCASDVGADPGGGGTVYELSPTGDDAATGDLAHPWATLAHACSAVTTPGDVIHLGAGTFNETARCDLAVGVSIAGEGIDVTKVSTAWAASNSQDGAIRLDSGTYTDGNQFIRQLTLDGKGLTATRAIVINYRNNVAVDHVKIADFLADAVFFRGSTEAWNVEPVTYATGNRLYDSVLSNSATRSQPESAHVRINGQAGFILCGNAFDQTARPVGQNGNILGGEWNQGLKIYGNTFTKSDWEDPEWHFFFELWHWEGGGEIHHNTFHGAATMDIVDVRKGTFAYGLRIYDNDYLVDSNVPQSIHRTQAVNLEDRGHIEYVYVYGNYFKNVPNAVWLDSYLHPGEETWVYVDHIYVYSNLLENVGSTDGATTPIWINGYGSDPSMSFDEIGIYNNTITSVSSVPGYYGIGWNAVGAITHVAIRNNIIQGFAGPPVAFAVGIAGTSIDTISIENNLSFQNSTNQIDYGSVPVANKTEQNNVSGDPLFVSPSDFHLQAGSPAINSGIDVGLPFKGSAPDIGVYESTF